MKNIILLTTLLLLSMIAVVEVEAAYEKDCYKTIELYGDPTTDTDVEESDLNNIKQITEPEDYRVSEVVGCILPNDGRLTA